MICDKQFCFCTGSVTVSPMISRRSEKHVIALRHVDTSLGVVMAEMINGSSCPCASPSPAAPTRKSSEVTPTLLMMAS